MNQVQYEAQQHAIGLLQIIIIAVGGIMVVHALWKWLNR